MSTESSSSISFVEIIAIVLCVVVIIFIFISKQGNGEQEKELRNAVRFQDVSEIADALWKVSISSTEYASLVETFPESDTCEESVITPHNFSSLLIPNYFETIPNDPHGEPYHISFDENHYVTVCSPWGEDIDGKTKLISITR